MPEKTTPENFIHNLVDTLADSVPKQKASSSARLNRLFGRQKPIHHILGGGKPADVLLWRNKKISASVLAGATAIWALFEWLNYHFLTLVFFVLLIGILAQFVWTNASGFMNRSPPNVPRLVLRDEVFATIGRTVGVEINRALQFLQDVSCGGTLKEFLMVALILWVAAVLGSWCNFLTVAYIGFVAAHTLPVLYEKYEDQVDDFVYKLLNQLQNHYKKLDSGLLSKIPKGMQKGKKHE